MDYSVELKKTINSIDLATAGHTERSRFLASIKSFVSGKKNELEKMHFEGAGGAAVVSLYTSLADAVIGFICSGHGEEGHDGNGHALIALGGYGRSELCFCSDLDIMLLHGEKLGQDVEGFSSFFISFLWDVGFKVGHSVRSVEESLRLAEHDDTVLTSMLEARLLCGSAAVLQTLKERLFAQLKAAGIKKFLRQKERERRRDYREAGNDVYHWEPNIKRTAGGLRDYHTGMWVALARFGLNSLAQCRAEDLLTEEQFLQLKRSLDFMWRVRNQMHLDNGTPHDVLTLSRQERIASVFGYRASRGALPVELFMQDYYAHAGELHWFYREMLRLGGLAKKEDRALSGRHGEKTERGLRIVHRRVFLPEGDVNWFRENPARLLETIWYCQTHGYMLSESALESMKKNLHLVDEKFRISPVVRDHFMAILADPARVGDSIRQMSDIGLLDRYLPEFAAIRDLVRYDSFHQYPVHEHTLRALENLAAVPRLKELGTDVLKQILPDVKDPAILSLAVLLHDLGKGAEGSHEKRGAKIAEDVAERLGLSGDQLRALRFLIRNHLKMTHLSQYRDLDDAEVIRSFAAEVESEENLNMLYLLTYADLYAVRQGSWNDWKSALLHHLYHQTRQALKQSAPPAAGTAPYWEYPKARAVCEYFRADNLPMVETHLRLLSERYLSTFTPKEIAEHIRMVASLKRRMSALKCIPLPQYSVSHVTVCTRDKLGLFAEIAGTFASQQVSILRASIFTRRDGIAIDSFHVVDAKSDGPLASTKWAIVKEHLRKVLRGERDVRILLQRAERSPRAAQQTMVSLRRGVHFDNRVSATHTVVDIEAPDRIGLLYDVASTFNSLHVNLSVAKVATDVRQARDAFYITDENNEKITDPLRLQEIRERIEEDLQQRKPAVSSQCGSTKMKRRAKA